MHAELALATVRHDARVAFVHATLARRAVELRVELTGDVITDARIFLGAVHSFPIAATAAADHLKGRSVADRTVAQELVEEAAALARDPATPMDNTDFTLQWRRRMVPVYVGGALRELLGLPSTARPSDHGLAAMQLEV